MDREHGPQLLEGLALVLGRTVVGMELPVRLGDAEIQFALADLADVVGRAARGRRRAADAVLAARLAAFRRRLVNQTADRLADDEIDARRAAGADGNERLVLGFGRAGAGQTEGAYRDGKGQCGYAKVSHGLLSSLNWMEKV